MAASLYRNYLRVIEKWRVDPTKEGRDLGEVIRREIIKHFPQGEATYIKDLPDCERKLQCLNRLSSNYYGKKYKRETITTPSSLPLEEIREILSTKSLEEMKKKNLGLLERIKLQFQRDS